MYKWKRVLKPRISPSDRGRKSKNKVRSVSVEELRPLINPMNVPDYEANARSGVGVFDTLKAVSKLVLNELKRGG